METLLDLKDGQSHAVRSAEDLIHEAEQHGRDLTVDEEKRIEDLIEEGKVLGGLIEARERQEALKSRVVSELEALNAPEKRVSYPSKLDTAAASSGETETADKSPKVDFARYGKLNGFANTPEGHEKAYRSGMWLRAHVFKDEHAKRWCKEHGVGLRSQKELDPIYGGNLVPNEMAQSIIDLRDSYGVIRQNATIMPMGRDILSIPKIAGSLAASFVGEETVLTEDEMSWVNVNLVAKKAGTLIKVSSEVAEDAIVNLADILATDMARAFALLEDQCGFIGDGTATYGGMTGWESALAEGLGLAGGVMATAGDDTFPEMDIGDISVAMGTLPEYARSNAKFYMSAECFETVFVRLTAALGGNSVVTLHGDKVTQGYMGYPIVFTPILHTGQAAQTDGAPLWLFGDMRMATIVGDRRGFALKVSDQRYMEYDQIGITATTRFCIVNHGVGTAATPGPMVALNANA